MTLVAMAMAVMMAMMIVVVAAMGIHRCLTPSGDSSPPYAAPQAMRRKAPPRSSG